MRRAVARGRVFPQNYSTDRRYGRLSLKAVALFPLMWVNADDQGRLCGDPEEIKYSCCPNIDHITKTDVPNVLRELEDNDLILCYTTPKSAAIQILDWWDPHRNPQWAWPSDYPPPEGWQDHLRYKKDAKTVITLNWPVSGEDTKGGQVSDNNLSGEHSAEEAKASQVSDKAGSGERSGENPGKSPSFPQTPIPTSINGNGKGGRRGRGNSPEGSKASQVRKTPSPSLAGAPLFEVLVNTFPHAFGRKPDSRELAQLRDLGKEISAAGGATAAQVYDAFKEACELNKFSISYVRAVLLDWLGIKRKE